MDAVLKADIFFFITTVAIVVLAIAAFIALVFLIQILRDVRHVSKRVREQSDRILSDVEDLRNFIKEEGKKAINFKELASAIIAKFLSKRKPRRPKGGKT
jgi:signal transduction histidine kinase